MGALIVITVISIILSVLSIAHITRRAFHAFNPFIHITCFIGSLVILALNVLDLLVALKVLDLELASDFSSIYFLGTSLTSILSCYVLIQVGSNFYQEYSYLKTILMFSPLLVSVGVFGLSVVIAIKIVLSNGEEETELKFIIATFVLSAVSGVLSLTFGILPLITIRSQTGLRPQQTAVSIIHFSIMVFLFITHFVVYTIITFRGSTLGLVSNSVENMILILIFPGSLFTPPRRMVKLIKRMVLGVEQLTIGGDFRPNNNNMIPDNVTNGSSSPINTQIPSIDSESNNNNNSSSSSQRSISTASNPISTISSPNPTPRSTPNSASPKRNEPPLVNNKSRSLFYPRSYLRARLQSLPGSYRSKPQSYLPQSQTYPYSNQPQQAYTYSNQPPQLQLPQQIYYSDYSDPQQPSQRPQPPQQIYSPQQQNYLYSNQPNQPNQQNQQNQQNLQLPQIYTSYYMSAPLPPLPHSSAQSPLTPMSSFSMTSSSLGSDTSYYVSKFAHITNSSNGIASSSNGEGSSNPVSIQYPQYQFTLR